MAMSLKTFKSQDLDTVLKRRLKGTARGLGYWAAHDYARKYQPSLLRK